MDERKFNVQRLREERKRIARRIREAGAEIEKMAHRVEQGLPLPSDVPVDSVPVERACLLRDIADAHERVGVLVGLLTQTLAPATANLAYDTLVDAAVPPPSGRS